jgi:hypothetical protein
VPIALIVGYFTRREPIRNGYQARRRTLIKGGRTAIIEPKDDERIVGDGAWNATARAQYPKRSRISEPRGS